MTDATNPQLLQFVERIENIDLEITGLKDDRKDILAEVKATGFDSKILLKVIAERAMERAALLEGIALLDTYRTAVGLDV